MQNDQWAKVKEVLSAALQRDPGERSSYVRDACGGDAELQSAVEKLLASSDTPSKFLEPPTSAAGRELLGAAFDRQRVDAAIGPYRTVDVISSGG